MKFERESWRKLYVSESIQHRLLPVLCRGLRDYVLRHASEDGTLLSKTASPARDLAMALGSHADELELVTRFVETWLEDGYLTHKRGRLFVTRFEEAQLARSPGAVRQARHRDRHKGVTSNVTGDVTDHHSGDARETSQSDETRRDETRSDERAPKPPSGADAAAPPAPPISKPKKPQKKPELPWPADYDAAILPRVFEWAQGKSYPKWWVIERVDLMRGKCIESQARTADWFLKTTVWLSNDDKTYGNGPAALEAKRARQPGAPPPPGFSDYEARKSAAEVERIRRRREMSEGAPQPALKLMEVPK